MPTGKWCIINLHRLVVIMGETITEICNQYKWGLLFFRRLLTSLPLMFNSPLTPWRFPCLPAFSMALTLSTLSLLALVNHKTACVICIHCLITHARTWLTKGGISARSLLYHQSVCSQLSVTRMWKQKHGSVKTYSSRPQKNQWTVLKIVLNKVSWN